MKGNCQEWDLKFAELYLGIHVFKDGQNQVCVCEIFMFAEQNMKVGSYRRHYALR